MGEPKIVETIECRDDDGNRHVVAKIQRYGTTNEVETGAKSFPAQIEFRDHLGNVVLRVDHEGNTFKVVETGLIIRRVGK